MKFTEEKLEKAFAVIIELKLNVKFSAPNEYSGESVQPIPE